MAASAAITTISGDNNKQQAIGGAVGIIGNQNKWRIGMRGAFASRPRLASRSAARKTAHQQRAY